MSRQFQQPMNSLTAHWGQSATLYAWLLFALFFAWLISIPIQYHDTDMWYHLAGGRHFFETGELYNPYIASYLTPAKPFINYFWGFQAAIFSTWSLAGEPGLIILKALMLLATALIAARIILSDQPLRSANALQLIAITLVVGLLCTKSISLRPHLGSFLFIPLFIYILMFRERWFPALPVLAIIWANLHGVEYVVGMLICGAFFLDRLYDWWTSPLPPAERPGKAQLGWILLCAPAILVGPNGFNLLITPFVQDANIWMFISELRPFRPDPVLDISGGLSMNSVFWLLAALGVFAITRLISREALPVAPLILAAGGAVLLLTASRFTIEWALLTTALLAVGLKDESAFNRPGWVIALAVLLSSLVAAYWTTASRHFDYYPLYHDSLASGTTDFIRSEGLKGRYAIAPSHAGYVEFERLPGVRIHMDMHFPPFTSDVFHELLAAMITAPGLKHYVDKYEPDMIGVDRGNELFAASVARELGYAPVFFDRRIALFVNRTKYPDVVKKHELTAINPMNETAIRADQLRLAISELERMLDTVNVSIVRETLAGLLLETGQLEKAQEQITALKHQQADRVTLDYLTGRLHHLNNQCEQAVIPYEAAIENTGSPERLHRLAAECYFVLRQPDLAYEHFSKALNPYRDSQPDPETYYQFALVALGSGQEYEAVQLLKMIPRIDGSGEYHEKARTLLQDLSPEDAAEVD